MASALCFCWGWAVSNDSKDVLCILSAAGWIVWMRSRFLLLSQRTAAVGSGPCRSGCTSEPSRRGSKLLTISESFGGACWSGIVNFFHCLVAFFNSLYVYHLCYYAMMVHDKDGCLGPHFDGCYMAFLSISAQGTCRRVLHIMVKWLIAVGAVQLLRSMSGLSLCPKCFTSCWTVFDFPVHNPVME